jgi:hypothetical protein
MNCAFSRNKAVIFCIPFRTKQHSQIVGRSKWRASSDRSSVLRLQRWNRFSFLCRFLSFHFEAALRRVCIHKSKSVIPKISSTPVQPAPHPRYSPDLSPSDFFLFGHLKSQMTEREFDSPEDLIRRIRVTFLRMSRDTIEQAFGEWTDRIEIYISHERSYFPET